MMTLFQIVFTILDNIELVSMTSLSGKGKIG